MLETVFGILIVVFTICFIAGVVIALCDDGYSTSSSSNSSSSSPSSKSKSSKPSGSYINSNIYGVPDSMTYVNDESDIITHVSIDGDVDCSASFNIDDREKIHFGLDGSYLGSTKQDGDKILRYGSDNLYNGYSKINENGTIDHYDWLGLYIGSSKK